MVIAKISSKQGEMVEAASLQSLASLEYWWVGAGIQDAEMKKMKCCEVRC